MAVEAALREPIVTFDWTEYDDVAEAVVHATTASSGADPMEMDPLYSAIDPDALNTLFDRPGREGGSEIVLKFSYGGYLIRVAGTGTGEIYERG